MRERRGAHYYPGAMDLSGADYRNEDGLRRHSPPALSAVFSNR